MTTGKKKVYLATTSTIQGYFISQAGQPISVFISPVVILAWGATSSPAPRQRNRGQASSSSREKVSTTSIRKQRFANTRGTWVCALCSYGVPLGALGGAIEMPPTPAVALAADTRAGIYTLKDCQGLHVNRSSPWSTPRTRRSNRWGCPSGMDKVLWP